MTSIDILVPVYNRANYLPGLLDSCLAQTLPANKIILVDDASHEPEVQTILTDYAARFANVVLITHETNQGICSAQETGLKSSTADFIAFLDCDDFLPAHALQMVAAQIHDEVDYIFTDRIEIDESEEYRLVRYGGQPQLAGKGEIADHLLEHMVASHLKVIRRTRLLEVGGFSDSHNGVQDWDIALKIAELGRFVYLAEPLYFHRVHANQVSQTQNVKMIRDTNTVRRAAFVRRNPTLQSRQRKFLDLSGDYQLSRILNLVEAAAEFNSAVGITEDGTTVFVPMLINRDQPRSLEEPISFLLIHHKVVFQSDDLKPFLMSRHPPSICYISSMEISSDASYRIRWLNSFFDYVLALDDLGALAIQSFLHDQLEVVRPTQGQ
jgi:glycosyltransferase involved in cell wall biosynthesis